MTVAAVFVSLFTAIHAQTASADEQGVPDFIARWNAAYTGMDAKSWRRWSHNQIDPQDEGSGQHVPNASAGEKKRP
jgi:hypothetical protein